jgi:hypothetical protein
LNVNSVVTSPSMCARRIFEITASGTPVVSTPSPAINDFFPMDEVPQVSEPDEAEWTIRALVNSPELRDRMVHRAQRRIWQQHTYTHRVNDVLGGVGLDEQVVRRPSVSVLVSSNRPHQIDHVLETFAGQQDVQAELLILGHGFEIGPQAESRAKDLGIERFRSLHADSDLPLGACLNLLASKADGDIVTKMDDDDLYGPHYLHDQLAALDYSGADVVGKQAHHMYIAEHDATIVRFPEREHRFTHFVMGPTIMTSRGLLQEHGFAEIGRGEDTDLLRRLVAAGATIYSCDRFGFVQMRQADAAHTWGATSAELLANGRVVAFGRLDLHALI